MSIHHSSSTVELENQSRLSHSKSGKQYHTRMPSLGKGGGLVMTMPTPGPSKEGDHLIVSSMVRRLPEAKKTSLVKILNHREGKIP